MIQLYIYLFFLEHVILIFILKNAIYNKIIKIIYIIFEYLFDNL